MLWFSLCSKSLLFPPAPKSSLSYPQTSLASWFTRSTCSKRPPLLLCLLPLFIYRFKSNQILDSDHQSVHYCFNNKTLKTFLPSLCPLSGTGLNWYHTVTTSNNKVHLKSNFLQNSPEVRNIFLKHYHNL